MKRDSYGSADTGLSPRLRGNLVEVDRKAEIVMTGLSPRLRGNLSELYSAARE